MRAAIAMAVFMLASALGVARAEEKAVVHESATRCVCCGRALGREVPESTLSADPDFKALGMFQCCQTCMDKKMDARTQLTYTNVARKYKWSSISHNKSMAFKNNRPRRK
jgi:hypothetical protein